MGFYIPMNYMVFMCMFQSLCYLDGIVYSLLYCKLSLLPNYLLQSFTLNVFHDYILNFLSILYIHSYIVDVNNVWVRKAGCSLRFPSKLFYKFFIIDILISKNFDCNVSI